MFEPNSYEIYLSIYQNSKSTENASSVWTPSSILEITFEFACMATGSNRGKLDRHTHCTDQNEHMSRSFVKVLFVMYQVRIEHGMFGV